MVRADAPLPTRPRAPARWGTGRRPGGPPPRKEGFGAAAERSAATCSWTLGRAFLDRHSNKASPLGPTAVVVPDAIVAEHVLQNEPGTRAAFADAAVGE